MSDVDELERILLDLEMLADAIKGVTQAGRQLRQAIDNDPAAAKVGLQWDKLGETKPH